MRRKHSNETPAANPVLDLGERLRNDRYVVRIGERDWTSGERVRLQRLLDALQWEGVADAR